MESAFPVSNEQDDDQVMTALDTASALWARGDAREALRWLRRAAELAGDAGDDFRAVQLARAAADLSNELAIPPTLVPASAFPVAPPSYPSHSPPSPPSLRSALSNPVPSSPLPSSDSMPVASGAAARRPPPPRRNSEPNAIVTSSTASSSDALLRPSPSAASPRPRQALQVAVTPSDEDRNLLYVRILAEGEQPPPGSHAALLVALEPQTNLLIRRR